jgi:hypothetical protein
VTDRRLGPIELRRRAGKGGMTRRGLEGPQPSQMRKLVSHGAPQVYLAPSKILGSEEIFTSFDL